ncbi:pentatricopeptide repeat-containing protein At1g09410, mitochondrial-like [Selaginella moellendorffii]|uniref:pentatricopeptide repeat-containing protein At1g09410, mitochondrial-like n=1 Tax=Selaginella moellendorffii TaxID=88036 RepID=UPI000D1C4FAE|nr:pentatricopeptide repeat-containing protein At1g09410, mitochondrial-like [Selaginella moellendorffii]|eukprot:XP_024523760.1 pentatricopeptide repeat-containing protein At1g09410, mitochondrial-like [Selaginella moellendorffii]
MLKTYVDACNLNGPKRLFAIMPEQSSITWSVAFAWFGHVQDGESFFQIMRETTLDDPSCADHSKIDKARAVFDALACLDMVSWNTCYAPDVHHCKDFFEKMPGPNLVSYNTLLSSLVSCRLSGEAVKIFVEMPEINTVTSTVMMQAYAREGQLASARDIYETMPDRSSVALITAQSLRTAFERFEKKQEAWSSIIAAYVQNGRVSEALDLFREMHLSGFQARRDHLHNNPSSGGEPARAVLPRFLSMIADFGISPRASQLEQSKQSGLVDDSSGLRTDNPSHPGDAGVVPCKLKTYPTSQGAVEEQRYKRNGVARRVNPGEPERALASLGLLSKWGR